MDAVNRFFNEELEQDEVRKADQVDTEEPEDC